MGIDSDIGEVDDKKGDTFKIKDIGEMSQYELFHYYKVMGSLNRGPVGLEFLRSAKSTGVAILCTMKDKLGNHIFGNDASQKSSQYIQLGGNNQQLAMNIAYYLNAIYGDGVYENISASFQGSNNKRVISMKNFSSEQEGSASTEDIRMAEDRAWSVSAGKMNDVLEWLESQMATYGLIKSPLIPISIVGKADKWDKDITNDEYFAELMEKQLQYEKRKVLKTLDAQEAKKE